MARKPNPSKSRQLYLSEVFKDGLIGPIFKNLNPLDNSYHENFYAEAFNKRANSRAFKTQCSDPDFPVLEQAIHIRQLLTARGYKQAMFGDPEYYHQATFSSDEVKDILNTIDNLVFALKCREDTLNSNKRKKIADERHAGSKKSQKALLEAWASGKYSTRNDCADQEWEKLGFPSYDAARDHLKGTPEPQVKTLGVTK
jgi:hypothetical protein